MQRQIGSERRRVASAKPWRQALAADCRHFRFLGPPFERPVERFRTRERGRVTMSPAKGRYEVARATFPRGAASL